MKKLLSSILVLLLMTPLTLTTSAEELLFSVTLISDQDEVQIPYSSDTKIFAEVGEIITFTRTIEESGVVNNAWEWNFESEYLDCAAYPEFDSPELRCEVLDEGKAYVYITMYPEMSDGSNRVISSNGIYVIVEESQPSEELLFSVTLDVDQDETSIPYSGDTKIYPEIGDIITFTRIIEESGVVNNAWEWHYDPIYLDCAAYPEFDSPAFRCQVIEEGKSHVYITMYPEMSDGSNRVISSNLISVIVNKTDQTDPTPESEISSIPLPPAGFEDEVITTFDLYNNPFPDTDITMGNGQAAAELYRRGIIGGYPDGEFKGIREVNRAEAAKFLLLARYEDVDDIQNNGKFPDVLEGEWYVKFVVTAADLGIINGHPDGLFKPADTVNTAEFIKILSLTFDLELDMPYEYIDVASTDWFKPYAGIAQKYELFPNRSLYLKPAELLTRYEVAVAIYQCLKNR